MAVYVNTNYSALQGQRYLGNVQNSLTTTYQRLSSGMRINSAKDDAAGLQIADRLTSQINGLNQGNRNASDGIALAQTVESGMDEISGMLQKIRTLAVQAANGTNTGEDKAALSKEATALANEISRIAKQTTYGGKLVLNGQQENDLTIFSKAQANDKGKAGNITLQVGSNKGDVIKFSIDNMQFSKIGSRADSTGFNKTNDDGVIKIQNSAVTFGLSVASGAALTIALMDKMIADVDAKRADLARSRTDLSHLSATSLTLLLMRLMHAHVFVMLILLKSLQTFHSSPSFSRPLLLC